MEQYRKLINVELCHDYLAVCLGNGVLKARAEDLAWPCAESVPEPKVRCGLVPHHDAVKSTSTGCLLEPWTTCASHDLSLVIATT